MGGIGVSYEIVDIECFNSKDKAKEFLKEYKCKHPESKAFVIKRHIPMWRGWYKGQRHMNGKLYGAL